MSAGLVVVRCGAAPAPLLRQALDMAAPGRFVAALWQVPLAWTDEPPIEAAAITALMSPPEARAADGSGPVAFHANLAVRTYGADQVAPARCFQMLLVRKAGPRVIARRGENAALDAAARLETKAAAFTRDWANNVWHLPDDAAEARIVGRLARLLCWPDEPVMVLAADGAAHVFARQDAPQDALVAVPERYAGVAASSSHAHDMRMTPDGGRDGP